MKKLLNIGSVTGNFNEETITLTSNSVVVYLQEKLIIKKSANKLVWVDDYLTYKITIHNPTDLPYENIIVNDYINPKLVTLVDGSIMVNGIKIKSEQYSFESGNLTIILNNINPNSETIIIFKIRKLENESFKLENIAHLTVNSQIINSNRVIVIVKKKIYNDWMSCDKPYLGLN